MTREVEIAEVERALARIPCDVAKVSKSADEYEYRIEVTPAEDTLCRIWLGFSTYDTYGLCFGRGFCFEDLATDTFRAIDVVSAILDGRVRETEWRLGRMIVKSKGEIELGEGQVLSDTKVPLLPLSRLARVRQTRYQPYILDARVP